MKYTTDSSITTKNRRLAWGLLFLFLSIPVLSGLHHHGHNHAGVHASLSVDEHGIPQNDCSVCQFLSHQGMYHHPLDLSRHQLAVISVETDFSLQHESPYHFQHPHFPLANSPPRIHS